MCQMNKIEILSLLSHEEHQSRDNHRLSIPYKNTIIPSAPLEDIHDTCGCHLVPALLSVPPGKKINCLRWHGANKWDKWPARTDDLPGQMTCQDRWPAGTNDYSVWAKWCLKLMQSISLQDTCDMNSNWLMLHLSNESTHINMDHITQSQKQLHEWSGTWLNVERSQYWRLHCSTRPKSTWHTFG